MSLANVATCCYIVSMRPRNQFETVGIRDFGNAISAYLRKVALGVRVLISDRGRIVAELRDFNPSAGEEYSQPPRVQEWISEGAFRSGSKEVMRFPRGKPILEQDLKVRDLITDLRGE